MITAACVTPGAPGARQLDPAAPVRTIADAYWEFQMTRRPLWATALGDRRFDADLPDLSDVGHDRELARLEELKTQLQAAPTSGLSSQDILTRDVLLWTLTDEIDGEVCQHRLWDVDQLEGYQARLPLVTTYQTLHDKKNADDLIARYRRVPRLFEEHIANLQKGLGKGLSAPQCVVDRVISQLGDLVKVPAEKSSFVVAVDSLPASWSPQDREATHAALVKAVEESVYPGLKLYQKFLKTIYRPAARTAVGISANADGARCYAYLIKHYTTTDQEPLALLDLGTKELGSIHDQMKALARSMGAPEDPRALMASLKANKSQYLTTSDALLDFHRKILERATAALPQAFGHLSARKVEVKPTESFREKDAPSAYYYAGPADGSRPGIYYVNTYKVETRPLYDAEALAFHEAVPGHHLQIALGQDLAGLPLFRRHMGPHAYIEGWGLYAERLADEIGLYSSPTMRFGMLNFDAWRASRLIVDTRMHAFGWTRQEAIDFLVKNTALPEQEAANEIDRYITWPGQALAYKVGQLEILAMRGEAKKRLGERFDLRSFHDRFLETGAVPLPIARKWIADWTPATKPAP